MTFLSLQKRGERIFQTDFFGCSGHSRTRGVRSIEDTCVAIAKKKSSDKPTIHDTMYEIDAVLGGVEHLSHSIKYALMGPQITEGICDDVKHSPGLEGEARDILFRLKEVHGVLNFIDETLGYNG